MGTKIMLSNFKITFLDHFCLITLLLIVNLGLAQETRRSKYFIALKKNEGVEIVLNTLDTFTAFLPPQNMLYADPMIFKHHGVNYLFFEEFDYKKGTIAYVTVKHDLQLSEPVRVIEMSNHLSFPYVFKEGQEIYMTPETIDLKEVGLYKAMDFPHNWQKKRVLVSGYDFSDPILFKYNNYYWLFVTINTSELQIFFANSLEGEFRPHPINLLKVQGRNAGGVFYTNNQLIRPVMDCRKTYGYAMILKEIVKLNTLEFEERDIFTINPTWAPDLNGTHTFSLNEDLIVYDGRRSILISEDAAYSNH